MADIQNIKCNNQRKTSPNRRKFGILIGNRGRRIERWCLNLHWKFTDYRFCAFTVQMLLQWPQMRLYAQLLKSSTVNRRRRERLQQDIQVTCNISDDFAHAQKLIRLLTQVRALYSQITLITFIVEPPKLPSEQANRGRAYKKCNFFNPLHTGHVIRRMRSGRVRIFNGNQWETLYLINQERIGMGSSNLVARFGHVTHHALHLFNAKGQRSRSQNHVMCQETKTLKLGSECTYQLQTWWELSTWVSTRMVYFLGQQVKQTGSRNMAELQNIKCTNQRKTSPNRRNFAL